MPKGLPFNVGAWFSRPKGLEINPETKRQQGLQILNSSKDTGETGRWALIPTQDPSTTIQALTRSPP